MGTFALMALVDHLSNSAAAVGGILMLLNLEGMSEVLVVFLYPPLFAVGFGSRQGLYPTIAADIFHGRHFGSIIGFLAFSIGMGAGIGPWLAGYLHDISGSYASSCWIGIVLCVLSLVCIWIVAPSKGADA